LPGSKSALGRALAARLGVSHLDGDQLHSPDSVAKMSAGIRSTTTAGGPAGRIALEDARRDANRRVLLCAPSLLPRRTTRAAGDVRFLHLVASRAEIEGRLTARRDHFTRIEMIDSQFATLEPPDQDEVDVATLPAAAGTAELVDAAERALRSLEGFKMSGSCCGAVVFVDQSAESVAAFDLCAARLWVGACRVGREQRESAVGSLAVVVGGVDAEDRLEVAAAEDQ
jgi:gluconokinase